MRIQHNIMAMNAYRNYSNNTSALSKNLEKLSSGYKINRAGDDAAGLAISEKMRAQITGLEAAQKNVKDGISLVNTAEGAMQEVQDMLNRMVYLATQSSNGTYDDPVDRKNLQDEVNQLRDEINRIADSANFNGIKLLDGSLSATGNKTVSVKDINSTAVAATAGKVTTVTAPTTQKIKEGDSVEYTVALSDGKSYTVNLSVVKNEGTGVTTGTLQDADGKIWGNVANVTTGATNTEIGTAVAAALKDIKGIGSNFNITNDTGKLTFENVEKGKTGVVQVSSVDWKLIVNGAIDTPATAGTNLNIVNQATDAGRDIDSADITLYDGTNYEDAVFTINGHKFVVTTGDVTGPAAGKGNATTGLGSDVTILIGDVDGNKGLAAADPNQAQNIAKIKEVTGLNVTAQTDNGDGIRLTPGGVKGGLTLQIGDTSDDYNQLTVSVGDIHTKALGIDGIDIGSQAGAQAAVDVIKNAINTVSSIRGTLGALSNRLDHTANNLSVMRENIQDAESTIRDTDVAEEMMAYTKNNILVQSAQAMLAQANQVPQGVLQLLQ